MLAALFFVVGALLVFFELIQPAYTGLQAKKGRQVSSQGLLDQEQRVVDQAKKLLSQYDNVSQAQSNLGLAMPSGPNLASALAQIYGIAQNNGMAVQSIGIGLNAPAARPKATAAAGDASGATQLTTSEIVKPVGTISFQVTAAGTYENLKNFLSQLETNLRVFDLTSLSLQSVPIPQAKGAPVVGDLFNYGITVVTYYQLP